MQTRTKLQQTLKAVLNCWKLEIVFEFQTRPSNSFRYKDKDLMSGFVYQFQCTFCNEFYYGESIIYLDIRSEEHVCVSPLTGKKVKPSNNSAVCDHLFLGSYILSLGNFNILAHENKKYLLEIKDNLLIMNDKLSLNKNISATL